MPKEFKPNTHVFKPKARKTAYRRGYNREWARVRKAYLRKHPRCSTNGCHELATCVDHKISLEQGGERYNEDNLQSFCTRCHNRKTNLYDGGFGNDRREYS